MEDGIVIKFLGHKLRFKMISLRPLSEFLTEKAANEINEDPKRLPDELKTLRNWLSNQPHLIARTDDQFLVAFLRGCKHSLEKSKSKLESYYSLRTAIPELFYPRDPTHPTFVELFSNGVACPLPVPHTKGFRVVYCRPGLYDTSRHHLIDYIRCSILVVDRYFSEDDHWNICGYSIFVDMQGYNMRYMSQVTLSLLKKVASVLKGGYPARNNGLHFLNFPSGLVAIMKILRSFLPTKIANQVFFHSDLESVYKYLPKNILPAEYGGEVGTLDEITKNYAKSYLSDKKWFTEDAEYKSDEAKRCGSPKTVKDLLEMEESGTLEID